MNNPTPPKWPLKFFRWFCDPEYAQDIEGDLREKYVKKPSRWRFALEVVKLFRPSLIKFNHRARLNNYDMLKHNLTIAFRNFKRYKASFFVNLSGLIAGLVAALFIYLWVAHELRVDKFHENDDNIYRLVSDNGGNVTLLNTSPRFAGQLAKAIPEIEVLVNSSWAQLESKLLHEEQVYSAKGEFASEEFFNVFTYPLIHGDPQHVLIKPNAIVLSERMALRLFNSTDVVGEKLEWRWYRSTESVEITGVYEDPPNTSSAQFDYVLSFQIFEQIFKERIERGNLNGRSFIQLTDGADVHLVNQKIADYTKELFPESTRRPYFLIGYSDYYLNGIYENGKSIGGRIELVRLFVIIGVLILVIACVNFMNLSTARAALRTKEIGVRKVMGAQRRSLIHQYLTESCLLSLFAGLSAIGIIFLLFPAFKQLTGQALQITFEIQLVIAFVGIIFFTGLISGSYPALYLSRFNPLNVLKGQLTSSSKDQWFRKGLVVFQFGISLILIISVIVVYHQMNFVQSKSLGYTKERILNFDTNNMNREKQQAFLTEVRKLNGVDKASGIIHALFGGQISSANVSWLGKDPEQSIWFEWGYVDYDMLELLEVEPIQGRFFSIDFGDERSKVVINEAMKRLMELEDPIGEKLTMGETSYEIIGVAQDFHFQSLHEEIKPTFFRLSSGYNKTLAIRIQSENMNGAIHEIEELYSKFNPGFPFEYSFHDQDKQELYVTEQKITVLSKYAAGLAIFISCLGLFGLVSFIAERKAKEMGIRKILGAGSLSLIKSLSRDFVFPIGVASIIGVVFSIFIMESWLKGFAYRIELQWWFFAASVMLMFGLAIITSGSEILKILFTNPVDTLKDE